MIHIVKKSFVASLIPKKLLFTPHFKTGPGEYGEGIQFIGVTMPHQRRVAKQFLNLTPTDIKELISDSIHEYAMTGFLILVYQFQASGEMKQKQIYDFYYENRRHVNNWDLVDTTADKIMGSYLMNRDKSILYTLAKSEDLWERRIAMLSCFAFIKANQFDDALAIAEILVNDKHDLMHKAVGWMLREIGKRDLAAEEGFLKKHYKIMPRTMLRYAIEKFEEGKRQFYLKGG